MTAEPTVVSIGSNLGERLDQLRAAVSILQPMAVSSVWETDPMGGVPQQDFLNLVVLVHAEVAEVWQRAQRAERAAIRVREVRWGPRTLDVDVITGPGEPPAGLLVPHPRAHERAFVLAPWMQLQPAAELPGHGPIAALLDRLGTASVRRTELVL